jgi:hypothetical protein
LIKWALREGEQMEKSTFCFRHAGLNGFLKGMRLAYAIPYPTWKEVAGLYEKPLPQLPANRYNYGINYALNSSQRTASGGLQSMDAI